MALKKTMRAFLKYAGIAVASSAGTLFISRLEGVNLPDMAASVLPAVCGIMLATIPVWAMLIAFFLMFVAVFIYSISILAHNRPPKWHKFTQMEYRGFLFRWDYQWGQPYHYREHCPAIRVAS